MHLPAPRPGLGGFAFLLFQEMRPKQWTKNLLLFAGLVFARHVRELDRIMYAVAGFLIFCGLSGAIYIFNDYRDAESDRRHPLKRKRPIASGALPAVPALIAGAFIAAVSIGSSWVINPAFGVVSTIYFVLMLAYSVWLKHIVILDLMVVSLGFVLRAVAGVKVIEMGTHIPITPWFITCVMFLALFLCICKRRHELVLLAGGARDHRPVLDHYSTDFLDRMVDVATSATVLSYALYVAAGTPGKPSHEYMVWTVPFVIYGVFRYLYLVYKKDEGGSPEVLLLKDPSLLICVVLWLISVIVLYR